MNINRPTSMNGQQLTNSSNSANGTPTSPSSSYPASLSSQSSRDPSPASRLSNALPAQISRKNYSDSEKTYIPSGWTPANAKTSVNLVNNYTSQTKPIISNPLLNNLSLDQHNNLVMPPPPPSSQIKQLEQTVIADHTQSNLYDVQISEAGFNSNNKISTHTVQHSDFKTKNNMRIPSPQATPPRTNVQGTINSNLESQPRHGTTSPYSRDPNFTGAQVNNISSISVINSTNPQSQIQTTLFANQPMPNQFQVSSNSSLKPVSQWPSTNQSQSENPQTTEINNSIKTLPQSNQSQVLNSTQPKPNNQTFPSVNSQSIQSSQNHFQPIPTQTNNVNSPNAFSNILSTKMSSVQSKPFPNANQNVIQPSIPQPNNSEYQSTTSRTTVLNQNQPSPQSNLYHPPSSQLSQNQFQPPINSVNKFQSSSQSNVYNPVSSQPSQNQFHPSVNMTNQFQPAMFPSNKNDMPPSSNPYQQRVGGMSRYPTPPRPNQQNAVVTQPSRSDYSSKQQGYIAQTQQPPVYQPSAGDASQGNHFNNQNSGQYPMNSRYPQMPNYDSTPQMGVDGITQNFPGLSVQSGFNKLWGMDTLDLLKTRDILPKCRAEAPPIRLQHELYEAVNCSPEIFRCTLTKIPETKSLLDKSRLPLGVLIHPFKDLNQLSVIQCTVIVRCRVCRTYINPFVYFVDNKRWKCNLCFRVNELPDEFQFDPMTKTYGDPSRRPEIKSATIEFIAPSEYMVRPPQPAIYVFLFDVSRLAADCGYLEVACQVLLEELDNLPGDARTSVAFITYDSSVHFYSIAEGLARPHQMVVVDIEDMFLPCPDNLLVNLNECHELIRDLLTDLPKKYSESYDTGCALGSALQAAYKLLAPTGGRITVFQSCLPNLGPGALSNREDPSQRAAENVAHLNPVTDFYKKLALECSGQQIAVDLFLVNSQYIDLATISGVSKFSGGCIHHFPLFRSDKPSLVQDLEKVFQRYLTRKIGFESVMRLRCTRGLSIHTFHGNFFVRSTDLLSLPNANPDSGFGMQVSIDENLTDLQTVCFQAALLYTSSKGERRIRVHTLCLPIASNLSDILYGADQHCIVGLLAKMAVDRSVQSSLSDAREAFLNVVADILNAFKVTQSMNTTGCVLSSGSLSLIPLYILALLKYVAFRVGQSTRLDDRVFAMSQMKCLPLTYLLQAIYPDLYPVNNLEQYPEVTVGDQNLHLPPRLHLSAERIDSTGVFLLDDSTSIIIYVGHNIHPSICSSYFDVTHFTSIPQDMFDLPKLDNPVSERLHNFVNYLQSDKPYPVPIQIIRDDSHHRMRFIGRLIEDKTEGGPSYYEFLQHIKALIK